MIVRAWRRRAAGYRTKLERTLDAWEAENEQACDDTLRAILARCHAAHLEPPRLAYPGEPVPDPVGADGEPGDLYGPPGDDDDDG